MAIFPLWDGEKKNAHKKYVLHSKAAKKLNVQNGIKNRLTLLFKELWEFETFQFSQRKGWFLQREFVYSNLPTVGKFKKRRKKALVAFCSIKIQKYLALRLKKFHTKNTFLHTETSKKLNIQKWCQKSSNSII